jgi:hypothetical protein
VTVLLSSGFSLAVLLVADPLRTYVPQEAKFLLPTLSYQDCIDVAKFGAYVVRAC